VLGRKLLVQSRLAAGTASAGVSTVLARTLACCKFVSGSSCHIECDELRMVLGILGKLVHGKPVPVLGTTVVVGGSLVQVARSRRYKLDHMDSS